MSTMGMITGPRFNIKMPSYQYRKSHCRDKTVVRSSYLHNGISYTGKMASLYWIRAQGFIERSLLAREHHIYVEYIYIYLSYIHVWWSCLLFVTFVDQPLLFTVEHVLSELICVTTTPFKGQLPGQLSGSCANEFRKDMSGEAFS